VAVELAQESRKDGPGVTIRVHDTGPGIHRTDFDRVFELGYTTKKGGFGMGLDICRRIIGRVEIEGRRGEVMVTNSVLFAGTTFSVCLRGRSRTIRLCSAPIAGFGRLWR
jgi:signal transduction histidine kinase